MKPDKCNYCKGTLKEGTTQFVATLEDQVIVIQDVPAWVCSNCEAAYFSVQTSRQLDELVDRFKAGNLRTYPLAAGRIRFAEIGH